MSGNIEVDETTVKNEEKNEGRNYPTFDELLTDPDYKASYDRKVGALLEKRDAQRAEESKKVLENAIAENTKKITAKSMQETLNLKIENALLTKGIDSAKATRISRLVNREGLLNEEGKLVEEKLKQEIEEVFKDFPEFSRTENNKGFVIGSAGKETEKESELSIMRKVMGLK